MTLFRDIQDCDGASPALSTNSGDDSADGGTIASAIASKGSFAASVTGRDGAAGALSCAIFSSAFSFPAGASCFVEIRAGAGAAGADVPAIRVAALGKETAGPRPSAEAAVASLALARGTRNCPRHFFSSHSTQRVRPAVPGKPQASHFRSPRKMGGTWL